MATQFKQRLKVLRTNRGLSQEQLSKALEVPASSIRRYETTGELPKRERLELIADYFVVSIDFLLGRTENPNQILSEPSRALIDYIDDKLTDEEIIARMDIKVDGLGLDDDSIKLFVALIRAQRAAKEQDAAFQAGGSKNL